MYILKKMCRFASGLAYPDGAQDAGVWVGEADNAVPLLSHGAVQRVAVLQEHEPGCLGKAREPFGAVHQSQVAMRCGAVLCDVFLLFGVVLYCVELCCKTAEPIL